MAKPKLNAVLYKLPPSCKYIRVERASRCQNGGNNVMMKTKLECQKMDEVLELLSHSDVGVWTEITSSQ